MMVPVPDIPHISGLSRIKADNLIPLDRSSAGTHVGSHLGGECASFHLLGRRIKIRAEPCHLDMPGSSIRFSPEYMDKRASGSVGVFHLGDRHHALPVGIT
ncbi:MAG: hypothetical protein A4E42_00593 [Methanoregulaceae archaeon PtaU1.Bin222]|nr:MAG: hypothetical protein A4E42_00593 [Methanoregulaceae archaeon PtaU1.Bin222]